KRYEDALKDKDKAIELEPENAEYYDSRGVTLRAMKRYEEALKDCNQAIELEPENSEYAADIARTFIKKDDLNNARFYVDKALSLDSTNAYALRARGLYFLALAKKGTPSTANVNIQSDFDQAIADDPENTYSRMNRAEFFIFTRQYDKAKEDLDRALALDPHEPEIYYCYSQYYKAIGDNDKAAEYKKLADEHGYIPEPTKEEKKQTV
ncbi:MAG: tetratricopeptide repeat protein, partial [Bacillota bacterium]